MKNLLLILMVMLVAGSVFSQGDPHYSMYMFNKLAINPAYAGSRDALTLTGHYRNQWEGIDGAPKTFTFAGHAPFFKNRVGVGLSLISDKIGMVNTTYVDMSYAYRIKVSDEAKLAIGLQGQLDFGRIDWSKADPLDGGDQRFSEGRETRLNPNFGLGVYYQHEKYYIGASVPRILKTSIYDKDARSQSVSINSLRSYYLMGGFVSRVGENVKFQPGALVSINPNAPFEFDLNASFVFMDALWVGASYRLGDSFDFILQYRFNQQLKAAIAADLTLTELNNYSPGSFELMLEYTLQFDGAKYNNIRYF